MAFFTIEEAIIKKLTEDSSIQTILGSNFVRKIFSASTRLQLVDGLFPTISVDINYAPEEPALPAISGVATIMMEFKELLKDGTPIKYSDISFLKEKILDALHKVDFSSNGLTLNHFQLISGSEPFFILQDKVWKWPLIFEFVHEEGVTIGRVGIKVGGEYTNEYTSEFG